MTFSMWMVLIICLLIVCIMHYLDEKWTKAIPATYDYNTSVFVAEQMTTLLTELTGQLLIYRPIDVRSVWCEPKLVDNNWVYRAKATQLPNAIYEIGLMKDFATLINRRAEDIGSPIRVQKIYPQGLFYIYDVKIIA